MRRAAPGDDSNYELFIGLLTLFSLAIAVGIAFIPEAAVREVLRGADTLVCIIFLLDFARSLSRAPSKRVYLFGERPGRSLPTGVVDLLGSIPSALLFELGLDRAAGMARLLRIFRLIRVYRLVEGRSARSLIAAFVRSRAEAAAYVVIMAVLLVIVLGSSLIALVEVPNPDSNINTAGDALWWTFVTITTVGYGDKYPITEAGRIVGIITMAVGIGIFGVLTSFLAKLFLEAPPADDAASTPSTQRSVDALPAADIGTELTAIRAELAEMRRLLDERSGTLPG